MCRRQDFYHQAAVPRERALTNVLPFSFDTARVRDLHAWDEMIYSSAGKVSRETHGDRYGMPPVKPFKEKDVTSVACGFKSLFQGDHLGVEFALESHTKLLKRGGLLVDSETILGHHAFPSGPSWQGLVIDDYFSISRERASASALEAKSVFYLDQAERIYKRENVFGSDDKTIRGTESFKVIGAEVLADERTCNSGIVSETTPLSKRIPMIALSLSLPVISRTLASRLAGNWVSVLMFRRCLCCLLSKLFTFGNKTEAGADEVIKLTRSAAEELVLASVMCVPAATDILVPYHEEIYATDASNAKGGITSKHVSSELAETLWLGGDKKGAYTMLDAPARSMLRSIGEDCDTMPVQADILASR